MCAPSQCKSNRSPRASGKAQQACAHLWAAAAVAAVAVRRVEGHESLSRGAKTDSPPCVLRFHALRASPWVTLLVQPSRLRWWPRWP